MAKCKKNNLKKWRFRENSILVCGQKYSTKGRFFQDDQLSPRNTNPSFDIKCGKEFAEVSPPLGISFFSLSRHRTEQPWRLFPSTQQHCATQCSSPSARTFLSFFPHDHLLQPALRSNWDQCQSKQLFWIRSSDPKIQSAVCSLKDSQDGRCSHNQTKNSCWRFWLVESL